MCGRPTPAAGFDNPGDEMRFVRLAGVVSLLIPFAAVYAVASVLQTFRSAWRMGTTNTKRLLED